MKTEILSETQSLCPVCLKVVRAWRTLAGETVFLEKSCDIHGFFRTRIWEGRDGYANWIKPKTPLLNRFNMVPKIKGCPLDCGLCPDHAQRTCTAVLEVTQRCNFHCAFCFAGSGPESPVPDPGLDDIASLLARVHEVSPGCNLQISGGEPTLRSDLVEIIACAKKTGFEFIQLNTNGYLPAKDPTLLKNLKQAGLSSVFLQFDGTSDRTYLQLRGLPLADIKKKAVSCCIENGIGVILVPTLVRGINMNEVGSILQFALDHAPGIRGVHFQPVSYFGRHPEPAGPMDHITIPEILSEMESQTQHRIRRGDFRPSACEHAMCSFNGKFMIMEDGSVKPLMIFDGACCNPVPAEQGSSLARASVARQWTAPPEMPEPGARKNEPDGFDRFLERARTHIFSVTGMAFQDVWNVDLERLKGCCIHSVSPDGRLIPFCAYNLTAVNGKGLYRTS